MVVAEKRRAVKRKFIEIIGHYNPILKPKEIVIDKDRALFWMKSGAQPSDTVRNLMADLGIIPKKDKVNIKYARDKKKKEIANDKAETASAKPAPDIKDGENTDGDKAEVTEVADTEAESKSDKVSAKGEEKPETNDSVSEPDSGTDEEVKKSDEVKESTESATPNAAEAKSDSAKEPKEKTE